LLYAVGAAFFMGSSLVIRAKESGNIIVTTLLISIGFIIAGPMLLAHFFLQRLNQGFSIKFPWV